MRDDVVVDCGGEQGLTPGNIKLIFQVPDPINLLRCKMVLHKISLIISYFNAP